jgi:hypothetical protein
MTGRCLKDADESSSDASFMPLYMQDLQSLDIITANFPLLPPLWQALHQTAPALAAVSVAGATFDDGACLGPRHVDALLQFAALTYAATVPMRLLYLAVNNQHMLLVYGRP